MIAKLYIDYRYLDTIKIDPDSTIGLLAHGLAALQNDHRPNPEAKLLTIDDIHCSINLTAHDDLSPITENAEPNL